MGMYTPDAAEKALDVYIRASGQQEEELQNNIVALMTDLMHIADSKDIPAEIVHAIILDRYHFAGVLGPPPLCAKCGKECETGAMGRPLPCPCAAMGSDDTEGDDEEEEEEDDED